MREETSSTTISAAQTTQETVVLLKDVQRFYETPAGIVKALNTVNLNIQKGDFAAIAGPSGSGKSTLLNLVGMLDTPTAGEVFVCGNKAAGLNRTEQAKLRREYMGFVFQAYNLIPVLNILENVEYVTLLLGWDKEKRYKRAREVLEQVGLTGLEERMPSELSGGQQQRVAVARAIASNPQLVLADEPTANLDTSTGTALIDMMVDLNRKQGITFIFSSHDPKVLDRAGRLITIADGCIVKEERRV